MCSSALNPNSAIILIEVFPILFGRIFYVAKCLSSPWWRRQHFVRLQIGHKFPPTTASGKNMFFLSQNISLLDLLIFEYVDHKLHLDIHLPLHVKPFVPRYSNIWMSQYQNVLSTNLAWFPLKYPLTNKCKNMFWKPILTRFWNGPISKWFEWRFGINF